MEQARPKFQGGFQKFPAHTLRLLLSATIFTTSTLTRHASRTTDLRSVRLGFPTTRALYTTFAHSYKRETIPMFVMQTSKLLLAIVFVIYSS